LKFIRTIREIDCAILGVHSVEHIEEIHAGWREAGQVTAILFREFALADEDLLNPARWRLALAR
jgi:hypothetical protein